MVGSLYHLEEMSRIHPDARRKVVDCSWDVVKWNLLKPTEMLVPEEVRLKRPLQGNEPFLTFSEQQRVKRISGTATDATAIADIVATNSKASKSDMQRRRDMAEAEFAAKLPGKDIKKETEKWFDDVDAVVADWSNDYLSNHRTHLCLPDDTSLWPNPTTLPTLKAVITASLARIYLQNAHDSKILGSDTHDTHHYAAASYADILVTEDKRFRAVLDKVPNKAVQVMSFNEFAGLLGVSPH